MDAYQADIDSGELETEIDDQTGWFEASDFKGLPIICVQDRLLFGTPSPASLRAAMNRVRRDYPEGYVPPEQDDVN